MDRVPSPSKEDAETFSRKARFASRPSIRQDKAMGSPLIKIRIQDSDALRSLLDWFRHEEELRGAVESVRAPIKPGQMGGALELLAVAVGSGGAATALVRALIAWAATRRSDLTLTLSNENGKVLEVDAKRIKPETFLRNINSLLAPPTDPE
ncbi:effector-associated constant component EACC1 [Nocardia testacea]|uniref:effector-associated constant component EACC1 n=1 Tax=Nocardia testacea TaxID=248551 RepID=UPI0033D109D0